MKTYNAQKGTWTSGGVEYSDSKLTQPVTQTPAPTPAAPTTSSPTYKPPAQQVTVNPAIPPANAPKPTATVNPAIPPATQPATTLSPTATWEERLAYYPTNTDAAYAEIARAQSVYQQKMAAGDIEGANAAHHWANQIRDAIGVSSQYDPVTGAPVAAPTQQVTAAPAAQPNILQTLQTAQAPAPGIPTYTYTPSSYQSPYSNDMMNIMAQIQAKQADAVNVEDSPFYESMKAQAEQEGDEASGRIMEEMNKRGILSSTITAGEVSNAQQKAMTDMLPVILQQAYGLKQDEINNLMSLLGQYQNMENSAFGQWQSQESMNQQNAQYQYQQQYAQYLDQQAAQIQAVSSEIEAQKGLLKDAYDRIKLIGYVDNYASQVTGIPVGTQSFEASKLILEQQTELDMAAMEAQSALEEIALKGEYDLQGRAISASRSGGGGGGGGGGTATSNTTILKQAQAMANNDPRLWMGDDDPPEGRYTYEELTNAYLETYFGGGGAPAAASTEGGGGISEEDLWQYLN